MKKTNNQRLTDLEQSIEDILATKVGPAGRDGADGVVGPRGMDGAQGEKGDQGPAGYNGRDGKDGTVRVHPYSALWSGVLVVLTALSFYGSIYFVEERVIETNKVEVPVYISENDNLNNFTFCIKELKEADAYLKAEDRVNACNAILNIK